MTEEKIDNTKKDSTANKPARSTEERAPNAGNDAAASSKPTAETPGKGLADKPLIRDSRTEEARTDTPATGTGTKQGLEKESQRLSERSRAHAAAETYEQNMPQGSATKRGEAPPAKPVQDVGKRSNPPDVTKVAPEKSRGEPRQADGAGSVPRDAERATREKPLTEAKQAGGTKPVQSGTNDVVPEAPPTGPAQGAAKRPVEPGAGKDDGVPTKTAKLSPKPQPEPEPQPEPPPKPVWKELEPEDRTDEVAHEVYECKKLRNNWMIMAASVRGKLHAHKAIWRDDAYAYVEAGDWTIIAVSDGAGAAKLSRIGARIACDESVKALSELLSGHKLNIAGDDKSPSEVDLKRLRSFLASGASAARDGIIREAHERQISDRDMYATMLLLIHCRWKNMDMIGALQVGDGAIGVYTKDDTCTVMGVADHGEYSSETVFLTSWKQLRERPYEHRVLFTVKKDVQCIAAMCDGVADDFFPEEKRLIELFIGNPIREIETKDGKPVKGVMHQVIKEPRDGEALKDWIRYEKRGSSDDRTLVLFYKE